MSLEPSGTNPLNYIINLYRLLNRGGTIQAFIFGGVLLIDVYKSGLDITGYVAADSNSF